MKIIITPKAQRAFQNVQARLVKVIDELEKNPFPRNCIKLTDQPGFRIRVGRLRILYLFDKKTKTIVISRIAHRRKAYRK